MSPDEGPPAQAGRDAVAIVLIRAGRMLVIQRAAGVARPGYWSPPTGWVEPGETPAQAAAREAYEELGLTVRPVEEFWRCRSDDGRLLIHWWRVADPGDPLRPASTEVAAHRFVDRAEYFRLHPTFDQHHPFFEATLPRLVAGGT